MKRLFKSGALSLLTMGLSAAPVLAQYDYDYDYTYDYYGTDAAAASGILAASAGVMIFSFIFGLAAYVYMGYALMKIAQKLNIENAWLAFVPIGNIYIMLQCAGIETKWMLLLLVAFVPFLNFLAGIGMMAAMVYLYMLIAEKLGFNKNLGFLAIVPVANFVLPGYLAWGTPPAGGAAAPVAEAKPEEKKEA